MAISLNPQQFGFLQSQSAQQPHRASAAGVSQPLANELVNGERQSAQQTANNMLGFIGNDIERLRASGASSERIAERIAAAREGVARGYAEAESILESRGLLTDELKEEIAAGRAQIEDGINRLEQGDSLQPEASPALLASATQLQVANSLSLEVMTRDGDKVSVSFAQSEARSGYRAGGELGFSSVSQSGWQMSVQGELDDAEQQALAGLFESAQDLSERFFSGDLGEALQQAMDLGFDGTELASMSLNLTQKTVVASTRAYSDVQPQLPTEQLEGLKFPLASYIDAYQNAIDKASALQQPETTLQDLVNNLLPEEERMPIWNRFHEGLAQLSGLAAETPAQD